MFNFIKTSCSWGIKKKNKLNLCYNRHFCVFNQSFSDFNVRMNPLGILGKCSGARMRPGSLCSLPASWEAGLGAAGPGHTLSGMCLYTEVVILNDDGNHSKARKIPRQGKINNWWAKAFTAQGRKLGGPELSGSRAWMSQGFWGQRSSRGGMLAQNLWRRAEEGLRDTAQWHSCFI